jgi:pilus assembly protein Flp/PilA
MAETGQSVAARRRSRATAREDESGQTLVEYALIIALIALAAIVALGFLSGKINSLFSRAGNSLDNVTVAAGGSSGSPPPPSPPTAGTVSITCSGGGCDSGDTLTAVPAGWTGVTTFTYSWRRNTFPFATCADPTPGGFGPNWTTSGITPSASSNPITNVPVSGLDDPYEVSVTGSNANGSAGPIVACVNVT